MSRAAEDPLALDREAMRRMGYEVVDLLVDRIERLRDGPVIRTGTRAGMQARIDEPPPADGRPFETLLRRLDEDVLPFVGHFDHPRFFGYIPGAGTWPAALGDLIASASNIDSGEWRESSGPSQLELTVLDWFRTWIGYPTQAAGILVSGGSAANLAAIACAREALVGPMSARIVAYTSDQTHSSVARAMRHLGFRPDQIRIIATDNQFRIRVDQLASAMDADAAADRLPFLVSANAGTTNTGAVDDLPALAELCHRRGVWLHVDGAYGAFAAITERGRAALPGLDLADSITLDPHKWLAMPFEVGCLMVRDGAMLERAFELHPEYLSEDDLGTGRSVNFADRGLQLTRASRAIKVWLSIQTFGLNAFREAIDRAIDQTLQAQRAIEADPRLELVTPASLGILTFRRRGRPDERADSVDRANARMVAAIGAAGDVLLTATVIRGRYAIRLCVLNHSTTGDDVRYALERVATFDLELETAAPDDAVDGTRGDAGIDLPRLADVAFEADQLRSIAVFAAVTDDQAKRFLGSARLEAVETGAHVTDRWAFARTFYVVLEGEFSVRLDDAEVNRLGPGDHFGEIGAIEWGRDFGYGRTATVVATSPGRLLAFSGSALRDLMAESRDTDLALRRLASERLDR